MVPYLTKEYRCENTNLNTILAPHTSFYPAWPDSYCTRSYVNLEYLKRHIDKCCGHWPPPPRQYRWPKYLRRMLGPTDIWCYNIFDDDHPTEHSGDDSEDEIEQESQGKQAEEDGGVENYTIYIPQPLSTIRHIKEDDHNDQKPTNNKNSPRYNLTAGRVHSDVENYDYWQGHMHDPWQAFVTSEESLQTQIFVK
ncbi:hypothetical protein K440DRAFT_641787 [Wilcoxina mikolae CBS 423.85]|nr:hypothetical protein K440DRAFT_641787 [Wilcoxina mikolae CBS 423.85]